MNKFIADANNAREDTASGGSSSSIYHRQHGESYNDRLAELEMENSRLHRLVAELLIKNQQLRKSN